MKRLSRPTKILIWSVILVLAVWLFLFASNYPSPTAEVAFRKAEKENLIGPAEVIEILDFEDSGYDHLLIAHSPYGYTFFEWTDPNWDDGRLSYQKKNDRVTLFCTYYPSERLYTGRGWLPIFAFAQHGAAVRARLTIETIKQESTATYTLEAEKSNAGYFLFKQNVSELQSEDFWYIQQLITGAYSEYVLDGTAKATVELYDHTGNLIETKVFTK